MWQFIIINNQPVAPTNQQTGSKKGSNMKCFIFKKQQSIGCTNQPAATKAAKQW